MTTRQEPFITSVEVRVGGGPHDYVTIWIRHQSVGTLCVGKGDGEELRLRLLAGETSTHTAELTPWMRGALDAMRDVKAGEACTLDPQQRAHVAELNRAWELTPCPQDLQPTEHTLEVAQALGFDEQRTQQELRKFIGFYTDVRPEPRLDWQALLRGWLRRSAERSPLTAVSPSVPFSMKGPLEGAPRLRPHGPWSTHYALAQVEQPAQRQHLVCMDCWNASSPEPPPAELERFANRQCDACGKLERHGVVIDVTASPEYNTWRQRVHVQRRISRALAAEGVEVERRMAERAANWLAQDPIAQAVVDAVRDGRMSRPVPLFEGPCPSCGFRSSHGSMCIACGVRFAVIDHPTAEAGPGAPAPSPPAAIEPEGDSRPAPARVPPAAGAPSPPPVIQAMIDQREAKGLPPFAEVPLAIARPDWTPDDEGRAREAAEAWRDEETIG